MGQITLEMMDSAGWLQAREARVLQCAPDPATKARVAQADVAEGAFENANCPIHRQKHNMKAADLLRHEGQGLRLHDGAPRSASQHGASSCQAKAAWRAARDDQLPGVAQPVPGDGRL
eukprot:CAMPEP_0175285176 /NCGR_PEP_ID=MMETSP0093-20121207/53098_1 /TAXON_ID=311494 /ORGANISM="Alexandrium monilatum, Strain CCMP3105" /LENGTH=117 /DNA_ID=CAMNT_0016580573 /DNA_START=109 /DNA_END=460 /DNA_ORIENTATION=-